NFHNIKPKAIGFIFDYSGSRVTFLLPLLVFVRGLMRMLTNNNFVTNLYLLSTFISLVGEINPPLPARNTNKGGGESKVISFIFHSV
ncbi:MAG TPA: hypothetical protein PLM56_15285, partial [Cyclobacteriaceae bacterium]|nr:hypothetical protein [Cyclobacteriaceae bacterium]